SGGSTSSAPGFSKSSDWNRFRLRHHDHIFCSNFVDLNFHPLICLVSPHYSDLQIVISECLGKEIITRLQCNRVQGSPTKALAEFPVLARSNLAPHAVAFPCNRNRNLPGHGG